MLTELTSRKAGGTQSKCADVLVPAVVYLKVQINVYKTSTNFEIQPESGKVTELEFFWDEEKFLNQIKPPSYTK
jgi:hypothetical protein